MIKIEESNEKISNCNVCGAINFDSDISVNKKVSRLTKILIGRDLKQQISLCDACLKLLNESIHDYISMTFKEVL